MNKPLTLMPRYQAHKIVSASKITEIVGIDYEKGSTAFLVLECAPADPMPASGEWLHRHKPEVGGYLVVYEDGYMSYSPAPAFESGYTRIL